LRLRRIIRRIIRTKHSRFYSAAAVAVAVAVAVAE
jgi:hypothetical protein